MSLSKAAEQLLNVTKDNCTADEKNLLTKISQSGLTSLTAEETSLVFSSKLHTISYLKSRYPEEFDSLRNTQLNSITKLKF